MTGSPRIPWVLLATLLAFGACAGPGEVDRAFAELRHGNHGPVSRLLENGTADVDQVRPYLSDADETVRREAGALLAAVANERACGALARSLTDASADIRERAARLLFERCDLAALPVEAGSAVVKSLELGNGAAASALLLGHFPGDRSLSVLRSYVDSPAMVKLQNWSAPVAVSLPAHVALLRLGMDDGRQGLAHAIDHGDLEQQVFLLQVLGEIDDRDTLRSLAGHLSDTRDIGGGVPSGATPRRRLCDLAVDVFAEKLPLSLSFERSSARRYSEVELAQMRQLVAGYLRPEGAK